MSTKERERREKQQRRLKPDDSDNAPETGKADSFYANLTSLKCEECLALISPSKCENINNLLSNKCIELKRIDTKIDYLK